MVLLAILWLQAEASAQQLHSTIDLAQHLVTAAFDSAFIPANRWSMTLGVGKAHWSKSGPVSIRVQRATDPPPTPQPDGGEIHQYELDGFVLSYSLAKRMTLEYAVFRGRLVHSSELENVRAELERRVDPTDADVDALLAPHRPKYSRVGRADFLKRWNFSVFRPTFGPFQVDSTEFVWRLSPNQEDPGITAPHWAVHISGRGRGRSCWVLRFEPIDGNLRSAQLTKCDGR